MAITENPRTLDLKDIQGMVTRGYAKLSETHYFLLRVTEAAKAKKWMKEILPLVDSADVSEKLPKTVHLAFGHQGLKALGLNEKNANNFPVPFREGINTDNRNRLLGDDYKTNLPKHWRWGKDNNVHIIAILHANKDDIADFVEEQRNLIKHSGGLDIFHELKGHLRADNKEPFGFHDGISQPGIIGSGRPEPGNDLVAAGEFLLGHKNEHNQYPFSPLILEEQGNMSLLQEDAAGSGKKDLGHNGTFMVFREMQQLVDEFWEFMEKHGKNVFPEAKDPTTKLAAKCIGRWPNGASLVNFPDEEPPGTYDNDDFGYAEKDKEGLRCPYGSHLRRNNPRDVFRDYNPKQSLKISNRHRIIRRGRNYKLPPKDGENKEEIGLQFICFNANLELQFEFIQHAWANNNQLEHLSNDIDMVIGVPNVKNPHNDSLQFTVQKEPVNKFVEEWTQFVIIKGGAYLFFPSISAINYLTTI